MKKIEHILEETYSTLIQTLIHLIILPKVEYHLFFWLKYPFFADLHHNICSKANAPEMMLWYYTPHVIL